MEEKLQSLLRIGCKDSMEKFYSDYYLGVIDNWIFDNWIISFCALLLCDFEK